MRENYDNDGEDERMNPYQWTCKKHGSGWGPIDECPKCMEESYLQDQSHEYDWVPQICWRCHYFDSEDQPHCHYYKFWTKSFEKKRKCCRWKEQTEQDLNGGLLNE
jgi:hypothetical protein